MATLIGCGLVRKGKSLWFSLRVRFIDRLYWLDGPFDLGFGFDGLAVSFLVEAGLEASTLDHEVVDYALENSAVVETAFRIVQEVSR